MSWNAVFEGIPSPTIGILASVPTSQSPYRFLTRFAASAGEPALFCRVPALDLILLSFGIDIFHGLHMFFFALCKSSINQPIIFISSCHNTALRKLESLANVLCDSFNSVTQGNPERVRRTEMSGRNSLVYGCLQGNDETCGRICSQVRCVKFQLKRRCGVFFLLEWYSHELPASGEPARRVDGVRAVCECKVGLKSVVEFTRVKERIWHSVLV